MSTTKIVHGYRSKMYHEVMVTSATENHARANLLRLLKPIIGSSAKHVADRDWEYFTMEIEFPDGSVS